MKSFTSEYFGFFIKPKDILDKRFGDDKSEQMKYIVDSYQVKFKDIYFVDDQASHLIQVRPLGVEVFFSRMELCNKKTKSGSKKAKHSNH